MISCTRRASTFFVVDVDQRTVRSPDSWSIHVITKYKQIHHYMDTNGVRRPEVEKEQSTNYTTSVLLLPWPGLMDHSHLCQLCCCFTSIIVLCMPC